MTQTQPYQINPTRWFSGHTFSAKEKDEESGYSYFGARYYDSDISVWLSVDPMASRYPSTSPYMYVRGNPVRLIDPNGMWDKDADGNWTATKGDSWWKLHKQSGMSWKETMAYAKAYNASKGRNNWKTVRVGDVVNTESSQGYTWSSGSSTTNSSTTSIPSTSSTVGTASGNSGNLVQNVNKVVNVCDIAVDAVEQTVQSTKVGRNIGYAISGSSKAVNIVSNTFKYTPYVGLGVTVLAGYYLSTEKNPATGRPYQSWAETGTDIGVNVATLYIGTQYGGWYGAGAAVFYLAVKTNVKYQVKNGINPGMQFIFFKE